MFAVITFVVKFPVAFIDPVTLTKLEDITTTLEVPPIDTPTFPFVEEIFTFDVPFAMYAPAAARTPVNWLPLPIKYWPWTFPDAVIFPVEVIELPETTFEMTFPEGTITFPDDVLPVTETLPVNIPFVAPILPVLVFPLTDKFPDDNKLPLLRFPETIAELALTIFPFTFPLLAVKLPVTLISVTLLMIAGRSTKRT